MVFVLVVPLLNDLKVFGKSPFWKLFCQFLRYRDDVVDIIKKAAVGLFMISISMRSCLFCYFNSRIRICSAVSGLPTPA
jgi:hypothetical protein